MYIALFTAAITPAKHCKFGYVFPPKILDNGGNTSNGTDSCAGVGSGETGDQRAKESNGGKQLQQDDSGLA